MARDKRPWQERLMRVAVVIAVVLFFVSMIIGLFVPQKTVCMETLNATEPISVDKAATLNDAIPFFNRCTQACSNAFAGDKLFECYKLCFDKIQVKDVQVIK